MLGRAWFITAEETQFHILTSLHLSDSRLSIVFMKEGFRRQRFGLLALTMAPFLEFRCAVCVLLFLLLRTQPFTPNGFHSLPEISLPRL